MDLREFFRDKKVIQSGIAIARLTPRWAGYLLANYVGKQIARRKPAVYWQVRENISHILGPQTDVETLNTTTKQAFINSGKFYYDYYHVVGSPPKVTRRLMPVPPKFLDDVSQARKSGRGVLLVGTHTSNFDLGIMSISAHGLHIQALSLANPPEGFKLMNKLREETGLEVTPIAPDSLRKAIARLKSGGIVATAIDWPQPDEKTLTPVFGKPAYVPLGAARLALMTDALVIVISFFKEPGRGYGVSHTEPLEMIHTGDRHKDVEVNTLRMIAAFEAHVSKYPDQWMMFHPFWVKEEDEQEAP